MGKILVEFEVIYHWAWCRETENIRFALQVLHTSSKSLKLFLSIL